MNSRSTSPMTVPAIAFPIRMPRGLLKKTDERDAYLTMIHWMARTPRGSWPGHPEFGFLEFFQAVHQEGISEAARLVLANQTVAQINMVLADLGLTRYQAFSFLIETIKKTSTEPELKLLSLRDEAGRGVTLLLREAESSETLRLAL